MNTATISLHRQNTLIKFRELKNLVLIMKRTITLLRKVLVIFPPIFHCILVLGCGSFVGLFRLFDKCIPYHGNLRCSIRCNRVVRQWNSSQSLPRDQWQQICTHRRSGIRRRAPQLSMADGLPTRAPQTNTHQRRWVVESVNTYRLQEIVDEVKLSLFQFGVCTECICLDPLAVPLCLCDAFKQSVNVLLFVRKESFTQ
jgi:hypothetical protein